MGPEPGNDAASVSDDFRIVTDIADGTSVIRVFGELDVATSVALRSAVATAPDMKMIVDLSGVTFIDSAGISVLAGAKQALGGALTVRPSARVRRVFQIAGLDDFLFRTEPNVD